MTHPPSRRQFLETAAAGMALGMGMMTVSGGAAVAVAAAAAQPGRRPRVAALTSVYFYLSHAYHIVGRFLDGFVVYPEDTAATATP
jgi:anaerobic selenocysteine-containing dehydrogenase